jgi:cytochrome P450
MTRQDASADLAAIDLTDASVWERAAPHDWLDRLRSEDPVHWHEESDGPGFWALTRHADVRQVSTSPRDFSSYVGGPLRVQTPRMREPYEANPRGLGSVGVRSPRVGVLTRALCVLGSVHGVEVPA